MPAPPGGQSGSVEPALTAGAAHLAQQRGLLGGLHPLGDDLEAEGAGHRHDPADQRGGAVRSELADQGSGDLQRVDGQCPQDAERGLPRAEVVEVHAEATRPEPLDDRGRRLQVRRDDRLGDLDDHG